MKWKEVDEDLKGKMVSYTLYGAQNVIFSYYDPSCYEKYCTKNVLLKAM